MFFNRLTSWQATLLLIVASSLLRLAAAGTVAMGTDEAHYALYGLHLDWSYFDHPPMIGWLQALVLPFSESTFALRLMPILMFAAVSVTLHRLTLTLFPHETSWLGFFSVALLHSGLMFQLIGLSMLPDDPLLLLGLLTLLALHGILEDNLLRHWLMLGLWLGLAGLSKYTAITLVITVLLALVFDKQWRVLRMPGSWLRVGLALIVSVLLIMPVLYWNSQHGWISFLYQLHHGTGEPDWKLINLVLSQIAQFMVYGPGIFAFGLIAIAASLNEWRERGVLLCIALALPVLLLFGWNSGYVMTLPHWTSLGWAGLIPLAVRWMYSAWNKRWVRVGVRSSVVCSLLLIALIFSEFISPWMPFSDNRDPLRDLYGWELASNRAEELREEMAATPGPAPFLFTEIWTYASRLAWYARPAPVQVLDNRYDQFDIWFGSPQDGARGILVNWPEPQDSTVTGPATGGKGQFAKCIPHDKLPIISNRHLTSTFSFYSCYGFRN
jgi:4-amino-4-deoxy-L-arabinose transferase-like glycosyltransferase